MEYQSALSIIRNTKGEEKFVKNLCDSLSIPSDSNILPFAWIEIMNSEPPAWMIVKDINIRQNYGINYTLAMWWMMKVNVDDVPEWMQHDSNIKADNGDTCLIIWLRHSSLEKPPHWMIRNYNFSDDKFDHKQAWKSKLKLTLDESQQLFTTHSCPDWLIRLDEMYEEDIKHITEYTHMLNDIKEYGKPENPEKPYYSMPAGLLDCIQNRLLIDAKSGLRFVKFYDEIYVHNGFSHIPLKDFYGLRINNIPNMKYLKFKTLDNICKLLDIICIHNCCPKIITESRIFRYIPRQLHKPDSNITYKLLCESDFEYIYGLSNVLPPSITYDCDIKGNNIKYYFESGFIKNKLSSSDLKPINGEFYEQYKKYITINDLESMKIIIKYYIDNKKPVPPEILS